MFVIHLLLFFLLVFAASQSHMIYTEIGFKMPPGIFMSVSSSAQCRINPHKSSNCKYAEVKQSAWAAVASLSEFEYVNNQPYWPQQAKHTQNGFLLSSSISMHRFNDDNDTRRIVNS